MARKGRFLGALLVCALALPLLGGPGVQAGPKAPKYIDLNKVPKPKITGAEIIAGLEEFVDKFPMRQQGLPNNVAAAEFLAAEAKKYGFKSRVLELETGSVPTRETGLVVEAIKKGTTKPDEWIVFVAHYDVVPGTGATVQGAYDDGSGTNMLRFFGKAFSKIKTKRSIVLTWFDAEENGLVTSELYTQMLADKGQKVHAALGFDMVGIGHPAPYCICVYHGPNLPGDPEVALPIINYVNFDFLKFPEGDGGVGAETKTGSEGHVCSCGMNPRNSDEQNFAQQGWFTIRFTGMKAAVDYLGYHQPWDTVPFMEATARSRENLEKGTENTFMSAYYTAIVLDNL
jgi:Peptidase family M28